MVERPAERNCATGAIVLEREAFAAISAVEGLVLSPSEAALVYGKGTVEERLERLFAKYKFTPSR